MVQSEEDGLAEGATRRGEEFQRGTFKASLRARLQAEMSQMQISSELRVSCSVITPRHLKYDFLGEMLSTLGAESVSIRRRDRT